MRDVARAEGVSAAAVSNFFQHPSRLSLTTAQRISAAASALGYRPNAAARSLRRSPLRALGFVADLRDGANLELLAGIESLAVERGWLVQIGDSNGMLARGQDLIDVLVAAGIAGDLLRTVDSVALPHTKETRELGRRSVEEFCGTFDGAVRRSIVQHVRDAVETAGQTVGV